MTPEEAVVMDWLLERGYTREQAARALVALTLKEPEEPIVSIERQRCSLRFASRQWCSAELHVEAELRGYLKV